MKILYGVVGEGMGHATRSRVVLDHLRSRGHEVRVVASASAATFLDRHFGTVLPIEGMRFVFNKHNRVAHWRTLASIFGRGLCGMPRNIATYFALAEEGFEPDVVISDFEWWAYFYAKIHGIPVFSLDNIQIVSRCALPAEVLRGRKFDYWFCRMMVRYKLPFCDHYFLTNFFAPEVSAERTTLHPPLLRREILDAKPERGDHVLVYQSGGIGDALVRTLHGAGVECRAYGVRRDLHEELVEGNVRHRPFDEASFIEDLRTARAVVATSGATLLSEALHLGKPVLATPILRQFEQNMNAYFLERAGYGRAALEIDDLTLSKFLADANRYEDALSRYDRGNNRHLLSSLDKCLESREIEIERRSEWTTARGLGA